MVGGIGNVQTVTAEGSGWKLCTVSTSKRKILNGRKVERECEGNFDKKKLMTMGTNFIL